MNFKYSYLFFLFLFFFHQHSDASDSLSTKIETTEDTKNEEEDFATAALIKRKANNAAIFSLQDDSTSHTYSPWAATFFSLAAMDKQTSKEANPALFTYNYVGVNYRINGNEQVSIRPIFTYQTAGNTSFGRQEAEFLLGDIQLQYAHFNLLQFPSDIGVLGQFRWFLPFSQASHDRKQFGRLETYFILQKPLPWAMQLNLHLRPEYYFQSSRSYLDERPFADGTPRARVRGNKEWELRYYFELAKMFSDKWGSAIQLGHTKERFYSSPSNNLEAFEREFFNFSVNFRYNVSINLSFIFAINNDIQTINAFERRKFGLWREDELGYALLTFWRF